MFWLGLRIALLAIAALGVVASANRLRFGRRVAREVREMWARAAGPPGIDRRRCDELPAPVRRYVAKAIGGREPAVRTVRLRHGGTFRTKLDGAWLPIRGEQYFAADPPGFLWWGRVRVAPGLWVEARDQMGAGRAGWYSYDHVDNGGVASATRIVPEYQHIAPGRVLPAIPGATDHFVVPLSSRRATWS